MYCGKKGFTIVKSSITKDEEMKIKKELIVKPRVSMVGMGTPKTFPIFRESESKLYVPKFYGYDKFGSVSNKIKQGISINTPFNGQLREYQVNIVNKYMDMCSKKGQTDCVGGLLDVDPGKGKTVMALSIISQLKVKTLVVVHKSFLVNQWKERIAQFLPSAKVGKIQGNTIDIEGKDIVIGMLQSLCKGMYSDKLFDEFGLSVYDECHHLSAEVFCNCMINYVTYYTLGLSGTMTRKDGLTKVFKWFIGPVIHKEKNIYQGGTVTVKAVNFSIPGDDEYDKVITNFKDQPLYSSMITKICDNEYRRTFILNVIMKELELDPTQQLMVLCHNKSLISYLKEELVTRDMDVGLYLGGMKEPALKESESKKIILATYSMASEGLDIKSLSKLLMATPKSDVCQSVGRILRSDHNNPKVIDVIDQHDIFKKQWAKRKKYYSSQNYEFEYYEHTNYFDGSNSKTNQNVSTKDTKTSPSSGKQMKLTDLKLNKKCMISI